MSVQSLEVKNDYNLFCASITPATATALNSQTWPVYASQSGSKNTQIVFSKSGKTVTVALPSWNATQTAPGAITIGPMNMPSAFYPSTAYNSSSSSGDIYTSIVVSDNGTEQLGQLVLSAEPNNLPAVTFYIYTASGGTFSGTGMFLQTCSSLSYFTDN